MSGKRFLICHTEGECWFEVFGEEELLKTLESDPFYNEVTGITDHEERFREYKAQRESDAHHNSSQQKAIDLQEALTLLSFAGPNPLLINESEYWNRYEKLTSKYFEKEDEDGD